MGETLTIATCEAIGAASVMARKGVNLEAIGAILDLPLPLGPATTANGQLRAIGIGPGTWLLIRQNAEAGFADGLAQALRGKASVSDQSSAYSILRLSGKHARTVLQRGTPIDLHPDEFRAGSAATTVIAHIGVIIWQTNDLPSYELATSRSYAASFRHWLDRAAAA